MRRVKRPGAGGASSARGGPDGGAFLRGAGEADRSSRGGGGKGVRQQQDDDAHCHKLPAGGPDSLHQRPGGSGRPDPDVCGAI